jgi:catechol-2,3-dioxygenase
MGGGWGRGEPNQKKKYLTYKNYWEISQKMKLSYIIFYVRDVSQAVAFYEQAFGLKQRFIHESGLT